MISKALRLSGARAFQHELAAAIAAVATEEDELFAVEEIRQRVRVIVLELGRCAHDPQIGERREADLTSQGRDGLLDIFAWPHVADGATPTFGHAVE